MRPARKVRIGNAELGLAFELQAAGVTLENISIGLGVTERGLSAAMARACKRGMFERRKAPRIYRNHTRIVNGIAWHQLYGDQNG